MQPEHVLRVNNNKVKNVKQHPIKLDGPWTEYVKRTGTRPTREMQLFLCNCVQQ